MQVKSFSRQVKCVPEYVRSFAVYVTSFTEYVMFFAEYADLLPRTSFAKRMRFFFLCVTFFSIGATSLFVKMQNRRGLPIFLPHLS